VDRTHLHHFSSDSLSGLLKRFFETCEVQAVAGRFSFMVPALFGNYLLFAADAPLAIMHGEKKKV
jgi:hypothetical protein